MSRINFNRKRAKLKAVMGIRARLVLLALILVVPLMVERVRSLEDMRVKTIAEINHEFDKLAQRTVKAQREVILSVEAILKSGSQIYLSGARLGDACGLLRASLPTNLPWIRNIFVLDSNGRAACASVDNMGDINLGDRDYFKRAKAERKLVISDYIVSRVSKLPTAVAAYPMSPAGKGNGGVIIAGINLDWMSKIMDNLGGRPGVSAVLVDSSGTVLAAPSDQASMIGNPVDDLRLLPAIEKTDGISKSGTGRFHFTAANGQERLISFSRVSGTNSSLIVSIDEAAASAAINRGIRTAYFQLGFVAFLVLLGALIAAERLIVQPIGLMTAAARRFGRGERHARVAQSQLFAEFVPLARAFNAMAAQLGKRERELLAANDRLTVMASIDMLSGLANRRGFQSRLDFEWCKAQQTGERLSLLMIDVDHFKLFNDTYGHLEGDACLNRLGEVLAGVANRTKGFAARYGGEEFSLLLPNTDTDVAMTIGETVRTAVQALALPHATSSHQTVTVSVGVACTSPNETQQPMDLVEAGDAALYAAKHRGRNAVVEHGLVRAAETSADTAAMKVAG
jgi:diguanylate cyclase (GGDEF)-like protein